MRGWLSVSAALGVLSMAILTIGIELAKVAYNHGGNPMFNQFNLLIGLIWIITLRLFFAKKASA